MLVFALLLWFLASLKHQNHNTIKDVTDIKFVINFDYPSCSEDYIHRIGRTARAENTGTAYTFFTPNNTKQAKDLIDVLREANQQINPKLVQMVESSRDQWGKGTMQMCVAMALRADGFQKMLTRG